MASEAHAPPLAAADSLPDPIAAADSLPDPIVPTESPAAQKATQLSSRARLIRFAKGRQWQAVLEEFEALVEKEWAPDLLCANHIVEAVGFAEGSDAARRVLQELFAKFSLTPNAGTYASLIRPLASGDPGPVEGMNLALAFYDEMLSESVAPDLMIYNSLIHSCTEAQDFARAEGIFKEMREHGVKPKSMSYIIYIYACFRTRQPDLAYKMLLNMEAEWRVPSPEEYGRMLKLFLKLGHVEGQHRCIKGLAVDGLTQLDPRTVQTLFKSAQEMRDPESVVQLGESLAQSGVTLDRFQQVGVIMAHLNLGQAVKAFGQLIDLNQQGHTLPERLGEDMATELSKQAAWVDASYYLLESRQAAGDAVPLPAANMVIEACALMGDLDRAFATWAELEQLALKPDTGTYNALLHACVRTREVASGRRLLNRMEMEEVSPDSVTYDHRAALLVMSRQGNAAVELLKECIEAGIKPQFKMYVTCINFLMRGRRYEEVRPLVEHLRAATAGNNRFVERVEADLAAQLEA